MVLLVGMTGVCTFKQVLGRLGAAGALHNRAGVSVSICKLPWQRPTLLFLFDVFCPYCGQLNEF